MEKCIYAYAWDFVGEGIDSALGRIVELGVDGIAMAVSYHAGKFILPHNPMARVYFPQDGTVYFLPDLDCFPGELKPEASSVLGDIDVLEILCERAARYGIKLHAWTVCMHNTRLGMLHPNLTVQNVYADRYPYSLCPAQPEAVKYVMGLISNLTQRYRLDTLFVESLGFMGFAHGYHHEFFGMELNDCCQGLLSLCFCERCQEQARGLGIDAERVAQTCRGYIDDCIEGREDRHVFSIGEFINDNPEVAKYIGMRCRIISDLVRRVRKITDRSGVRLDYFGPVFQPSIMDADIEGLDIADVGSVVDHYVIPVASADIDRIDRDIRYARSLTPVEKIKLSINLSAAATPTKECFEAKMELLTKHNLSGCNVYNYSTIPFSRLAWIKE